MLEHHEQAINKFKEKMSGREDILALLVSGSIAHGFAKASSDVDVMLIVSDENYLRRRVTGELTYWENESTAYESGYVDGKYVSEAFLRQVAAKGSEPARFAFEGAMPVFSKLDGLEELLADIVRYPVEQKQKNIARFMAQLEAWRWYAEEARKHENLYLLRHSVNQLILFGGRLILAHNEILYPYHKWFLKVLEQAPQQPSGLMQVINDILREPAAEQVEAFYQSIKSFAAWGTDGLDWPARFMEDSELNWLHDFTPIGDL